MVIWKEKVIEYYINKLCHFENITTFWVKENYAKIKRQLNNTLIGLIIQSFFKLSKKLKFAKLKAI